MENWLNDVENEIVWNMSSSSVTVSIMNPTCTIWDWFLASVMRSWCLATLAATLTPSSGSLNSNSYWFNQEIHVLLWNLKVHSCIHRIIATILGEECILWNSSLCICLHSSTNSCLIGPDFILSKITASVYDSFCVGWLVDHLFVSHLYLHCGQVGRDGYHKV